MKMSIEHHTHTMIPGVDAFLRLWDAIRDPALGYNLDTGWTAAHRDYPPEANLQGAAAVDEPARARYRRRDAAFPHIGEGVMDFRAICALLKATGFRGFLSLEQDKHPGDMRATTRRYLALMKEYLA